MSKRAYAVIVAGFFTVSIAYAIRYGYGMLLPEMLPGLGISKTQAGAIFATYFLAYTIATPLLGALSDRFNYRAILTLFSFVLASGAAMMSLASTFPLALLFFSLAGLGHAACWAPVTALVQKWVPDKKRGTALSLVTMGVGLGIPLWSVLLPAIVDGADWRAGWLAMGLFGMAVAAMNFLLVRNPDHAMPTSPPAQGTIFEFWASYRTLLTKRAFWVIGTAYLLVGFNVVVPFTFLPVYSRDMLGLSYAASTRFVAFIALSGVVGQLTLGPLSDAVGRVRVMMLCGLIMGSACLGMAFSPNQWMLSASAGFYGLGYGSVWPVYAAAATDFFSKQQTGGIVGLWTVFLGVGSVVSPVICGWTIDLHDTYRWAFLFGLLSGVLSSALLLGVADQRGKRKKKRASTSKINNAR